MHALGFPYAFVGVVIALLVLLPESIAAIRAAALRPRADQPQPGLRVGDGLDRPDHPDHRGRLDLARRAAAPRAWSRCRWCCSLISVPVAVLTVVPGRAKPLQGGVHLVLLAAFVFLSISP